MHKTPTGIEMTEPSQDDVVAPSPENEVDCKNLFKHDHPVVMGDLKVLRNFAKEYLFEMIKFVFHKSTLDIGNLIYEIYMRECTPKLTGTKMLKNDIKKKMYCNFIWTTGTTSNRPAVQSGLSSRRTTVYNFMHNKFQGKFWTACGFQHVCI